MDIRISKELCLSAGAILHPCPVLQRLENVDKVYHVFVHLAREALTALVPHTVDCELLRRCGVDDIKGDEDTAAVLLLKFACEEEGNRKIDDGTHMWRAIGLSTYVQDDATLCT